MSESLLAAIVLALPGTFGAVIALLTYRRAGQVHELVNSKMGELVVATKGQAHAEGVIAGEASQRERHADDAAPNGATVHVADRDAADPEG